MKINLKPQKDAEKTELKLPRSGFVHLAINKGPNISIFVIDI